jgi:hypothetical protein
LLTVAAALPDTLSKLENVLAANARRRTLATHEPDGKPVFRHARGVKEASHCHLIASARLRHRDGETNRPHARCGIQGAARRGEESMIQKSQIEQIAKIKASEVSRSHYSEEPTTYKWGQFGASRMYQPITATFADFTLTLAVSEEANCDGYYVFLKNGGVSLSPQFSGLPKLIYSPQFTGCHLGLFTTGVGGGTRYVGAHIYKGDNADIPAAVTLKDTVGLELDGSWGSEKAGQEGTSVSGLIWVNGDDTQAYWLKIAKDGHVTVSKAE